MVSGAHVEQPQPVISNSGKTELCSISYIYGILSSKNLPTQTRLADLQIPQPVPCRDSFRQISDLLDIT